MRTREVGRIGLLALLTVALVGRAAAEEGPPVPMPARVALIEGDVLIQAHHVAAWVEATANLPLGPGDWIWVPGSGRAEVQLPTGHAVRLGDATRLGIWSLPTAGSQNAEVSLDRGMAWITTLYGRGPLRVRLPEAVVEVAAPAVTRLDVFGDGGVQVAVYGAGVSVETPAGVLRVRSGQTLRLARDQAPAFSALAAPDAFDRWNEARDRQVAREPSAPSLPAPLASHAADFAAYGRWVSVPVYGEVWAPFVGIGWTPFRFGRWVWWRGECVWVADEPWGWLPYHYGRWFFDPAFGWVWVPPAPEVVLWNPGAVVWIGGGEFVAWVPLAPGEVVSGPTVVNVVNIHVTQVNITNVFVNARIRNATVVVPKRAFTAGQRTQRVAVTVTPRDVLAAGGRVLFALPASLRPASLTVAPRPVSVAKAAALRANPPDLPRAPSGAPVRIQSVRESVGGQATPPTPRGPAAPPPAARATELATPTPPPKGPGATISRPPGHPEARVQPGKPMLLEGRQPVVIPPSPGSLSAPPGGRSAPALPGAAAATPGALPSSGLRGVMTTVVPAPQPGAGPPAPVHHAGPAEQSIGTASRIGVGLPPGAAGGLSRPR